MPHAIPRDRQIAIFATCGIAPAELEHPARAPKAGAALAKAAGAA